MKSDVYSVRIPHSVSSALKKEAAGRNIRMADLLREKIITTTSTDSVTRIAINGQKFDIQDLVNAQLVIEPAKDKRAV